MFKKVQLKFFSIITSILIAIFIAVLSSVNIIMDALMERQTKVVLQQVASGVEFNDNTNTFTFMNPDRRFDEPKKDHIPQTSVPEKKTDVPAVTTAEIKVKTDIPVSTAAVATEAVPEKTETPAEPKTPDIPEETEHKEEISPTEPERTAPQKPTEPIWGNKPWDDRENGGDREEYPPEERPKEDPWFDPWFDPWRDPWKDHRDWNNNDGNNDGKAHPDQWGWGGEYMPTSNIAAPGILDGYTVIGEKTAKMDDIPPMPPPEGEHEKFAEPVPKSLGSIEFFVIMADENGKYRAALNNDELTEEAAQLYIDKIFDSKKTVGMTGNLSYCTEKKNNGTLMVFTDRTAEIDMMKKLKRTTVIVGIMSIILLSAASYFLSGLIVKPIKETFEKQKQFISDASHELKTPLTVISANADVLSGEIGENKWLKYIQDQAERMNVLVNDLLSLTRLENKTRDFITTEFDLSRAVTNASLPFECQAFESRKNFVLNVEDGIMITGSEQHIKQMTGIFIDNALKYSKDGGTVRVSLTKEDGKVELSVYNTGSGVKESEKDKLFERFYRSDESRNRSTGGYGLGLAIAKSIIDKHKFKVIVDNDEGRSICFRVIMT